LKSVLTEARKTYKTVKTVKQDTRTKKATESKTNSKTTLPNHGKATESKTNSKTTMHKHGKARRQVVKKNVDNPDEQQLLKVLQKRLELDHAQA
jgi:hypothetical protein